MKNRCIPTVGRAVVAVLVVVCTAGAAGAQPEFTYAADSESAIIQYSRTPGELEAADRTTTVTVHGNGRMVVSYPSFGVRQGDYETTLSRAELDELVASLVDGGMMEFDKQAVAEAKEAILRSQNMGFYVGDADVSTLELSLATYRPSGEPVRSNVQSKITVSALQLEAQHFSAVESLVNLAAAERQLIQWLGSERLRAVR